MSLLTTLINGHAYDFSSIKLCSNIGGAPLLERFTALSYEHGVDVGELRGRGSKAYGTTRGQYSANGSMTIYKEDFELLKGALMLLPTPIGGGYLEKRFMLNIAYAEAPPAIPVLDILRGCRIIHVSNPLQRGSEPLMVELELHIMEILLGGIPGVIDGSGVLAPVP